MRKGIVAFPTLLLLAWAADGAAPDNKVGADVKTTTAQWARFRGPNGTGVAADKDVPVEFSDTKNVLWKTAIPGAGNSSPIIWGDRVFLESASADGKERLLVCVDALKG